MCFFFLYFDIGFYIFLTLFLGPTKTLQPTQLPNNDLLESDDNAENSEDEELGEMKSAHELRTLRLQKKIIIVRMLRPKCLLIANFSSWFGL